MRGKGGRCHRIGPGFVGAVDAGRSFGERVMCIVRTTAVIRRHSGAACGGRPGSWGPGVPGLGLCQRGSAPYWRAVLRARRTASLERRMGGPVNTANRWSGRPSEPFATRHVRPECGHPRTLG
jgi:hypothetical protein